ncbi:MAG: enoyl-ACP reductase [Anaerolineae bacterium]|nr:enoyl-ACP reductase [Anaerolineae bacterium]MCK6579599.1 enoyl-ACP reductase [Anaerolineae bacterium]NUQ06004.1 enoyl-ACP reductase [Anaerolineae bacterium]
MGLMDGKIALIFGVANKNSIAWGITQRLKEEGATILLCYAGGDALRKRVLPLAEEIGCEFVEEADVQSDEALDAVFAKVAERYGRIDTLVHSVAFANRDDLGGRFVDISRDGFKLALDISAYSLIAMSKRAAPLMPEGGSIMSMTYYAAEKVMPKYHVMAIAKAALEAITKYLANDLGPQGIRVNAISAGPIKTLAAAGVPGIRMMLKYAERNAPLRASVKQEDVGDVALFLASDLSRMVTGEVIYVDAGYHVIGLTLGEDEMAELNKVD